MSSVRTWFLRFHALFVVNTSREDQSGRQDASPSVDAATLRKLEYLEEITWIWKEHLHSTQRGRKRTQNPAYQRLPYYPSAIGAPHSWVWWLHHCASTILHCSLTDWGWSRSPPVLLCTASDNFWNVNDECRHWGHINLNILDCSFHLFRETFELFSYTLYLEKNT